MFKIGDYQQYLNSVIRKKRFPDLSVELQLQGTQIMTTRSHQLLQETRGNHSVETNYS